MTFSSSPRSEPLTLIADFVGKVGIPIHFKELTGKTFLPGIELQYGALLIDKDRIEHPGDILHEAGHVAILPARLRTIAHGRLRATLKEEHAAMAWSWAALLTIHLDPRVVFHDGGYFGKSKAIIRKFKRGQFTGVIDIPGLQWYGMTNTGSNATYPNMAHWLNPE